jgi:hypothetical protein
MSGAESALLVSLMRDLSDPRLSTYELLVDKLIELGFQQLNVNIPVLKDVAKFTGLSFHKKGNVTVQVSSGRGNEAGHAMSFISLNAMDKAAPLDETIKGVAQWLGADPEYPAKAGQFAVLETDTGWTPIPLAETKHWQRITLR